MSENGDEEGDGVPVAPPSGSDVGGSQRGGAVSASGGGRRGSAASASGGSRRGSAASASGGSLHGSASQAGSSEPEPEPEEETPPRLKAMRATRRDMIANSRANSLEARDTAFAARFQTVWSEELKGKMVQLDMDGTFARQTGIYPRTDGTSVWSADPLPATGVHYYEVQIEGGPGPPAPLLGESLRGGFFVGVAKHTRTVENDEGEFEEVPRDTAGEQYIFSIEGAWGLEDSPECDGGPLRENGRAVGGYAGLDSRKRWGTLHQDSPSWALAPLQRNAFDRAYGHGERIGVLADCDARPRTLSFYRSQPPPTRYGSSTSTTGGADAGLMERLEGCVVSGFPAGVRICATVAAEGSSAHLFFPLDPVTRRLDAVDRERMAAAAARLAAAKQRSGAGTASQAKGY